MEVRHLQVRKTARIYVEGDIQTAESVWIALHGYGQNAAKFAEIVYQLRQPKTTVIVPEGLHRFYQKGFYGDVGASWMTKEDRENDILDYVKYMDQIISDFKLQSKKLNVLAFSQGTATAIRWICKSRVNVNRLVLWAGTIPEDLNIKSDLPVLRKQRITYVVGNKDPFLNEDKVTMISKFLKSEKIDFEWISFDGKHQLNRDILKELSLRYSS